MSNPQVSAPVVAFIFLMSSGVTAFIATKASGAFLAWLVAYSFFVGFISFIGLLASLISDHDS